MNTYADILIPPKQFLHVHSFLFNAKIITHTCLYPKMDNNKIVEKLQQCHVVKENHDKHRVI